MPAATVFTIGGNFYHLPRYTQILHAPERGHRSRLACLLGCTLGNLSDECYFLRNCLLGFAAGDMLLIDIQLTCAPTDALQGTQTVTEYDPYLGKRIRPGLWPQLETWLAGLIRRYSEGPVMIDLAPVLNPSPCRVQGTYSMDVRAHVRPEHGPERNFSMLYLKRYDPAALIGTFGQEGWGLIDSWICGTAPLRTMLCLFAKR